MENSECIVGERVQVDYHQNVNEIKRKQDRSVQKRLKRKRKATQIKQIRSMFSSFMYNFLLCSLLCFCMQGPQS